MDSYNFIFGMYVSNEIDIISSANILEDFEVCGRKVAVSEKCNFYRDEDSFCIFHGKAFFEKEQVSDNKTFYYYFKKYGIDFFRMLSGYYIAVVCYDSTLYAASSKTASPSLYCYYDKTLEKVIFSTELKKFPKDIKIINSFELLENINSTSKQLTNIKDIYKIVSGSYLKIDFIKEVVEYVDYYSPLRSVDIFSMDYASKRIKRCMNDYFEQFKDIEMACLVSGGLDSSIVATLAKKRCKKLDLFCIGTEQNNEFEYAQLLADELGLKLEKIIVSNEDFLLYFVKTIELIEHSHSTFIEYLIPIVMAHEKLKGRVTNLISGYGSDILFAGFANRSMTLDNIADLVLSEFESTYWSNETSQNLGEKFDINVFYPFFDDALIETSFRISPDFKFYDNIEKYILRYTYKDELPEQIVWRKKVGVHEGTGLEAYLSEVVRCKDKTNIRRQKDKLGYRLFYELIIEEKKIEDIDIKEILYEI